MGQSGFQSNAVILGAAVLAAVVAGRAYLGLHPTNEARAAEAPPPAVAPVRGHAGAAEIAKGPDGHFWAEASVGGRHVRFLVDTGATAVALTAEDARRVGIDVGRLDYDREVTTAAGPGQAAEVELPYVAIAGARVEKVKALVIRDGLSTSLLGMTYLGRLASFEASPGVLILRP